MPDNTTDERNTAPQEVRRIDAYLSRHPDKQVGIITPFARQRAAIEAMLRANHYDNASCGTVHAFQGDEKDVPEKMTCKGVELDVVRGCVKYQGQQVDLSKNELKILHYLFLHQGEIVPRIELVEYLWDQQVFIDDNALSVNITRLRAKLAEIGVCDFIETKRGMGYRI